MAVPVSLGKAKKKQLAELLHHTPVHRRFDEDGDEEEYEDSMEVTPQTQKTGNLVVTEVHLYDGFGFNRGNKKTNDKNGKKGKQNTRGGYQNNEFYYDYDGQYEGDEENWEDGEIDYEDGEEQEAATHAEPPAPKRDYSSLPVLQGNPEVGRTIAYRTLELSADYQPILAAHKEATVISFDPTKKKLKLRLAPESIAKPPEPVVEEDGTRKGVGKFELGLDDGVEMLDQYLEEVEFHLDALQDVRIVPAEEAEVEDVAT